MKKNVNSSKDTGSGNSTERIVLITAAISLKVVAVILGVFILVLSPLTLLFAALYFIPNRMILKRRWATNAYFITTLIPPVFFVVTGFLTPATSPNGPDPLYSGLYALGWILAAATLSAPLSLWFAKKINDKFQPSPPLYAKPGAAD